MRIEELMYYGRYYSFENRDVHLWWFDSKGKCLHSYDDVVQSFGFMSQDEMISSGEIIPLFETDMIKLEEEFLTLQNRDYKRNGKQNDKDFDAGFREFIAENSLTKMWFIFEYFRLREDAVAWCRKNHIDDIVMD